MNNRTSKLSLKNLNSTVSTDIFIIVVSSTGNVHVGEQKYFGKKPISLVMTVTFFLSVSSSNYKIDYLKAGLVSFSVG